VGDYCFAIHSLKYSVICHYAHKIIYILNVSHERKFVLYILYIQSLCQSRFDTADNFLSYVAHAKMEVQTLELS
jgi:hypothetical protein